MKSRQSYGSMNDREVRRTYRFAIGRELVVAKMLVKAKKVMKRIA